MTIEWDRSLVEELSGRRVIPFLGAGATMSCERKAPDGATGRAPDWPQLLSLLRDAAQCSAEDLSHIATLIEKDKFLDAAQIIQSKISKQEHARILRSEFQNLEPGLLHESILRLDQRLVMTTNYDCAYEDFCMRGAGRDGYAVLHYYDDGLINRLRSPTRLILKLHGSVRQPEKTVLSRSEYFRARASNPHFFSLVQSLFATSTILFIGFSLLDPDIQLLLETTNIGGEDSFRHYAVIPSGTHEAVSRAMSEAYGINLIEYDDTDGHAVVAESLAELADMVEDDRLPAS